jgi:hypothetical protein
MKSQTKQYVVKENVTLQNRVTNEVVVGDILSEDEIEGKKFFVVRVGMPKRVLKLAKDAYTIKKSSN